MAEETDNSLDDLAGGGESGSNPKEDTKTPNGATTTTTTVTTTTTTTITTRTTTATTTTTSTKKKDHSSKAEGGTEGGCGSDVDSQSKTTGDGSSSAGSSGGRGTRLRHRIYRPRLFESSSEDSDDDTEKGSARRLRTKITGGGEVAGKDSGSPASTEPGQEEVEMEPASPEGMETTGGNTDNDATGDYVSSSPSMVYVLCG